MRVELVADPDDDSKVIIARYGDGEHMRAVAEVAKRQHNEGEHGDRDLRVLGHYPAEIVDNYCYRLGITLREFMSEPKHANNIMRDPDLRDFRVDRGRV